MIHIYTNHPLLKPRAFARAQCDGCGIHSDFMLAGSPLGLIRDAGTLRHAALAEGWWSPMGSDVCSDCRLRQIVSNTVLLVHP